MFADSATGQRLFMRIGKIWLGLGANVAGSWGKPRESLSRAIRELEQRGLATVRRSKFYLTVPLGAGSQPHYVNAVIEVRASIGPAALLRLVKRLERKAGRRLARHWGPRPLDIDILDFGGRRVGRGGPLRPAGRLLLPHPEIAHRGFVLVPLADAAPEWRHPHWGVSARHLLQRGPHMKRGVARAGR